MSLVGQVAVVTGAAQGIGKAAAMALAEAGATVVVADIAGDAAEAAAAEIAGGQRRALGAKVDVGEVAEIDGLVMRVIEAYGQIDILVNNAGVTRRADIMELTEADWDRIHRVNAKGVFFCPQRVAREMIPRRSGRIINIASIAGKGYAGASNVAYAASKGGGDRHDQAGRAATGDARDQCERSVPGGDAYGAVGCEPRGAGAAGRDERGRDGAAAGGGDSVAAGE